MPFVDRVDNLNENNYRYDVADIAPSFDSDPPRSTEAEAQRISSETLFGEKREMTIVHNGREYRLRITQNDKLILTA